MVGIGFSGALIAASRHAAAQEYGVTSDYTIGAPGQVLASRAPRPSSSPYRILGKRTTRQNFGPVRGPVKGPKFQGKGFMRFASQAWKMLYAAELRKRMGSSF